MIEQLGLFLLMLVVAFVGVYAHWLKKRMRKQTGSTFFGYIKNHPQNTLSAIGSIVAAIFALFQSGDLNVSMQTIALAFSVGFSLDSAFNKIPEEK